MLHMGDVLMPQPKFPPFPGDPGYDDYLASYLPVFSEVTRETLLRQLADLPSSDDSVAEIRRLELAAGRTLYECRHFSTKYSSGPARLALVADVLKKSDQLDKALYKLSTQQIFPSPANATVSRPVLGQFKYSLQEIQEAIQELAFRYEEFLGTNAPQAHLREMNPPTGAGRHEPRIGFVLEAARTWARCGGPVSFNLQTRPIPEDKMDPDKPDRVDELVIPDGIVRFVRTACQDLFERAGIEPYSDVALRSLIRRHFLLSSTADNDAESL